MRRISRPEKKFNVNVTNWSIIVVVQENKYRSSKNYIMGIVRYPQELPGVMKMTNNYIIESGNSRNFSEIHRKEHTGFDFNQTQ